MGLGVNNHKEFVTAVSPYFPLSKHTSVPRHSTSGESFALCLTNRRLQFTCLS